MAKQPWDIERDFKYRDHDITVDDINVNDINSIKGIAVRGFVDTKEADGAKLVIAAFMGYLSQNGYRIIKK